MDTEGPHVQALNHLAHATDVIAVRMGNQGKVDLIRFVPGLDVFDESVAIVLEAGVNNDYCLLIVVRSCEPDCYCVTGLSLISDGEKIYFIHQQSGRSSRLFLDV